MTEPGPTEIDARQPDDVAGDRLECLVGELAELLRLLDLQLQMPRISADRLDALREARARLGRLYDLAEQHARTPPQAL